VLHVGRAPLVARCARPSCSDAATQWMRRSLGTVPRLPEAVDSSGTGAITPPILHVLSARPRPAHRLLGQAAGSVDDHDAVSPLLALPMAPRSGLPTGAWRAATPLPTRPPARRRRRSVSWDQHRTATTAAPGSASRPREWRHDPADLSPVAPVRRPERCSTPRPRRSTLPPGRLSPSLWRHDPAYQVAAWGCGLAAAATEAQTEPSRRLDIESLAGTVLSRHVGRA
jgi:hypothetical protein